MKFSNFIRSTLAFPSIVVFSLLMAGHLRSEAQGTQTKSPANQQANQTKSIANQAKSQVSQQANQTKSPANQQTNQTKPPAQASNKPSHPSPTPTSAKAVIQKRDEEVNVNTNTKHVTIIGEVVDTWCYTSGVMGPGRGEGHRKCARLCVSGGVTSGIVADDGTLYIAAKHQGYKGCAGLMLPYVGDRVKVQGWLAQRGGCNILKINSVERVK